MNKKVILVWFRNDLRVHDNEVLYTAVEKADFVIPVFIFDSRYYEVNKFGFLNTGDQRQQYIYQTVLSFKEKLQSMGGDLMTFHGLPEEIIPHLVQKYDADEVYHHREVAQRETDISELVEEALWKIKRNLKHFIGHTLYHKEDLPFPIKDIPTDFNIFKKKIYKESTVRQPVPTVHSLSIPPHLEKTTLVQNKSYDFTNTCGEDAAIDCLQKILKAPSTTTDPYTVLSPYLAIGSLSPIFTHHYISSQMNAVNKKMVGDILDGLLRRDYFRFMLKKMPNGFFINKENTSSNEVLLEKWTSANTEYTRINELMTLLNTTGNLTYMEREILGLFFIYEYKLNWVQGAAWFEQQLLDYAPATNYGFWAHLADQGTSKKNNRTEKDWEKIRKTLS